MSYNYVNVPMPQRTLFNKSYTKHMDLQYGQLVPVMNRFVMPGDTWKIGCNCFIRYNPLVAPPLNRARARIRYFFVPLRLVEPQFEDIVTGSHNGKLISGPLPVCKNLFENGVNTSKVVGKHSLWDYLGVPPGDYSTLYTAGNTEFLPARYWCLAYLKIWFEYYRDENIDGDDIFDTSTSIDTVCSQYLNAIEKVRLPKDYFTSALPFQDGLKGVAPTITISQGSLDFSNSVLFQYQPYGDNGIRPIGINPSTGAPLHAASPVTSADVANANVNFVDELNKGTVTLTGQLSIDDMITMSTMEKLFARLALTGTRYTEFLSGLFGVAPRDETLQRPKYLGSVKVPIITTEVVQTAEDSTNPVGTIRGKGITNGSGSIGVHSFKEYGVIYGLIDVIPETIYSNGIDRELTYKSRFDFPIPMFQHLSEQEIRNGELWVNFSGSDNDTAFGFHPIYEELKHSQNMVVGDLRPGTGNYLAYWTQALEFSSRPNLNQAFLSTTGKIPSYLRPFAVQVNEVYPMVCDFYNDLRVYRPLIRDALPKL